VVVGEFILPNRIKAFYFRCEEALNFMGCIYTAIYTVG
jgi:hypothetical protein